MDAQRSRALLSLTTDLVWFADGAGIVTDANPACVRVLGWDPSELRSMLSAFTVASRAVVEMEALPHLRGTGRWTGDLSVRACDGEAVPVSLTLVAEHTRGGGVEWIGAVARDLRPSRSREDRLRRDVTHDPLTGLPWRQALLGSAATMVAAEGGVVVVCDVDQLRIVNDTMGQSVGDQLLSAVAARLRDAAPPGSLVGRVGDDEFAIVVPGQAGDVGDACGREIQRVLAEPFGVAGRTLRITTSIGLADVVSGRGDPTHLLRDAGIALDVAKSDGKGRLERYDADMNQRVERRRHLAAELEWALARSQLRLVYQPIVDLNRNRVEGVEALVRWQHPTFGAVPPDVFVPLLEQADLIGEVGTWIRRTAIGRAGAWHRDRSMPDLTVNVNVSALQVTPDLADVISAELTAEDLPGELLKVELTESSLAWDAGMTIEVLCHLRSLGVRIALDDFGTGYSSLARLQALPLDDLKIDRRFIDDLGDGNTSLVAAICTMAHALGMRTVAEGIETEAQAHVARDLSCDLGQGYLWSRPVEEHDVPAAVARIEGALQTSR